MSGLIHYPSIDPFIFRIGEFGLSWYFFMYLLGFAIAYVILRLQFKKGRFRLHRQKEILSLLIYCFYGLIIGARLFYIVFYYPSYYLEHPWEIPAFWHGGMSFHGGLLGIGAAIYLFCRNTRNPFLHIADQICLCAPFGLFFGRIGNFINGELYGRVTHLPWGMIFPRGGPYPRHPSQIYEALTEGLILGLILIAVSRRPVYNGTIAGLFVAGYGFFRFWIEFTREPDAQLGTVLGPFSMGQILCFSMILGGIVIISIAKRRVKPG